MKAEVDILWVVVVERCETFFLVATSGWVIGEVAAGVAGFGWESFVALFLCFELLGASEGSRGGDCLVFLKYDKGWGIDKVYGKCKRTNGWGCYLL